MAKQTVRCTCHSASFQLQPGFVLTTAACLLFKSNAPTDYIALNQSWIVCEEKSAKLFLNGVSTKGTELKVAFGYLFLAVNTVRERGRSVF